MTDERQKRLILLTAILDVGGAGRKSVVLDHVAKSGFIALTPSDKEIMASRDELVWRNNIAFVRKHLVDAGHMDGSVRDQWAITPRGRLHFRELVWEAERAGPTGKLTAAVIRRATELA